MSTPITGTSSSTANSTTTTTPNAALSLTSGDFLKLMVTQLENQDPTQPTDSSELLSQMSQIGQLQSTTDLQSSLTSFGLQTSISSASSMIGKTVQGLDANSNAVNGVVTSVAVQSGNVSLSLDNGQSLSLANVTSIAPGPTGTTSTTH